MAKPISVAPPNTPMILTEPGRKEETPRESPRTRGSSTIVCPTAHSNPASQPVRVARRVEARNRGPGVRAPDELAIITATRKSGVINALERRYVAQVINLLEPASSIVPANALP